MRCLPLKVLAGTTSTNGNVIAVLDAEGHF